MKKFFLFAAALFGAATINATEIDFTNLTEADFTVTGATLDGNTTATKLSYAIVGGDHCIFEYEAGDYLVQTDITNSADKEKILVIGLNGADQQNQGYVEFGGKNGILTIDFLSAGTKVTIHAAAKGGTDCEFLGANATGIEETDLNIILPKKAAGAEGADDKGYVWKDIVVTATGETITLKETKAGYRFTTITIEDGKTGSAVENTAAVKATKLIENGQVIILKNGVRYNVLGAEMK